MSANKPPFGAVFNYDQRVTWDEQTLGIMVTGKIVTPSFDMFGNATKMFVVRPDDEFDGLIDTCKNGWVNRHIVLDNLRHAHNQTISYW